MTTDEKLNLLIDVLQAIADNYEAGDFLYPQDYDEFNIDFAFTGKPEHFVFAAIKEDLQDLQLPVVKVNVYQDDVPYVGGYLISIVLREDWIKNFSISGTWAEMVLQSKASNASQNE